MSCPLRRSFSRLLTLLFGAMLAAGVARAKDPPLPAFNAAIDQTSVSGISSGAFMAVQFATAWSSIVKGVGAVAGGPFDCAEGSAATALGSCMLGTPPTDLQALIRHTDAWSRGGAIDNVANLAHQKIYLFSGYNDTVVQRPVVNALDAFYVHFLGAANTGNLFYQTAIGAGHAQITISYGGACSENGGVYIDQCDYDQAGIILQHIYGALHPPDSGTLTGRLLRFDQGTFTRPFTPAEDSMGETGFVYVPQSCAIMRACRVHVALHGCGQSYNNIGEAYVRHAGYNEWADANRIIVLYPQAKAELFTAAGGNNPEGCWDWWGYLDTDPMDAPTYLLQTGWQIRAIKAMIDRLTSRAKPAATPSGMANTAPSTVLAIDATDRAIDLAWTAVPGATRYQVFRANPDDATLRQIGSVAGLSYADAGLRPATTYRYQVRASSPDVGPLSAVVSHATLPAVPPCEEPGTCPLD